jgi:four helix bundle protein
MAEINSFRDLKIWQNGLQLAKEVYLVSKLLPKDETFGLVSQMRRAVVSVSSNIAEGRARSTRKDFCQFLRISMGSLAELETQLILTQMLYPRIKTDHIVNMVNEEQRMTLGMIKKLQATS